MKTKTVVCPECKREIVTTENRFGVWVYRRHKMATAWKKSGMVSQSVIDDLKPGHNAGAAFTHELDCPNSGQPVS